MKKKILIVLSMASALTLSAQINSKERKAALGVIERTYPEMATRLKIKSTDKAGDCDVFHQTADDQRLTVTASSPVAACRGVYDFIRNNEYGIASWTGSRLQLPESFTQSKTRRIVSPFAHHYYFNVVTYGYTMPYWDWQRWEQEIDWMALHGIDMPLALVANEAISARVWKKLGLTDAEIADYFVGPAHLPWMRMGNISGIDGPLPQEWHEGQIELQHKILQRMRSLGMKPICPAFAGFVPKAMKRLYPDIKITETSWGGAFHNWMLSPQEELFHTIGKMFIQEWEKDYEGKNDPTYFSESLLRHYYKHKDFYLLLYNQGLSNMILETLRVSVKLEEANNNLERYAKSMIAGMIWGWIDEWMRQGMPETPEEIVLLTAQLNKEQPKQ